MERVALSVGPLEDWEVLLVLLKVLGVRLQARLQQRQWLGGPGGWQGVWQEAWGALWKVCWVCSVAPQEEDWEPSSLEAFPCEEGAWHQASTERLLGPGEGLLCSLNFFELQDFEREKKSRIAT